MRRGKISRNWTSHFYVNSGKHEFSTENTAIGKENMYVWTEKRSQPKPAFPKTEAETLKIMVDGAKKEI